MHEVKILLVDDEPRNLDALGLILNDPSYRLLRAENADVALKLLIDHDVAAIVLDIKMPGVSGFELAQIIKGTRKFRNIPIVFLSAYLIEENDVVTGYSAGAVDYLTKPVNPLILRHKVAVFADLFRKTRALAELNDQLEARVRERTAQLEERSLELERANRMKDEFLATLSHELRTPLNAILGWATILKRDRADSAKLERGLHAIERNATAQSRLVTDLLDMSSILSGKLRLEMTKFPLANAVRAAADAVRLAAEAKNIRLVLDLNSAEGTTLGDAGRMQQIVWNLLSNAIRHTPPGGRVTVTAQQDGSVNLVRVEDTGVGIPAEHLPFIFEPFRQVDSSTTRAQGGLGLGLALVRRLAEAHGGSAEAKSDGPGLGATFTISLPNCAANVPNDASAPAKDDGESADAAYRSSRRRVELATVRVLLVEDDPDSREVVCALLEGAGASVVMAGNAREALSAFDAQAFDVVVSDVGMAGIDGYEFMRHLRSGSRGQDVPSIALTAYARGEDVERSKQAGYQKHLSKPVDSRKLIEAVKALVEGRRSHEDGAIDWRTSTPASLDSSIPPGATSRETPERATVAEGPNR